MCLYGTRMQNHSVGCSTSQNLVLSMHGISRLNTSGDVGMLVIRADNKIYIILHKDVLCACAGILPSLMYHVHGICHNCVLLY